MKFLFYVEFLCPVNREWKRWNVVYEDALEAIRQIRERQKYDDTFERRVVSICQKG